MEKASVRGKIISELVDEIQETTFGKKISNGEVYQNPIEPKWICPPAYRNHVIEMRNFKMELLHPKKRKDSRVILHLHGGGFIGVMRNAYRRVALQYCKRMGGGCVLSVDYRVAPKHPYPAALEDATEAYLWLIEEQGVNPENIIVAGDSAGGGLALSLAIYLKDQKIALPGGFILMSPWTDQSLSGDSLKEKFDVDPLFGGSTENMIFDTSYRRWENPENPYISPLFGDVKGLAPMLFQVGENEMLQDDTLRMAKKAREANVKVRCTVYPGMFHVFQMGLGLIPESRKAWEEVGQYLDVVKKYKG